MSTSYSVIGGTELPQPLRVTSDGTDAVVSRGQVSPDGGVTWLPAAGNSEGVAHVLVSGEAEELALTSSDKSAALSNSGTISTSGATTVSSIVLTEGQRLVIRRLLATLGGTTAASAPLVVMLGSTTIYTAQVNVGAPVVVCEPLAPLVLQGPAGGSTVYIKFNTAVGAAAVYGVVVSAVLN